MVGQQGDGAMACLTDFLFAPKSRWEDWISTVWVKCLLPLAAAVDDDLVVYFHDYETVLRL